MMGSDVLVAGPEEELLIKPQPGGQVEALSKLYVFELLFGGAAGPGKSWELVVDALGLQYVNTPLGKAAYECKEYRAVLFRRKTTQFARLIDEGKKMYVPLGGEYVAKRTGEPGPSFTFPAGAKIFICHMEQEENKEDHQGQQYQFVGFDELTQFTVTQYLYLFSRLRSTILHINTRVRSTTNPTGSGLMWVKKRFIKHGSVVYKPRKVHYFAPDPIKSLEQNPTGIQVEKDHEHAKSRMFIPGRLTENKILMDADPLYKLNIIAMGKKYEKALLDGDWDAFGGDFFDDFDSSESRIDDLFEIPDEWNLFGSVDPGWKSPCSFSLHAVDFDNNVYTLFTTYQREQSPTENARYVKERIEGFSWTNGKMPDYIVAGKDAWAKKDKFAVVSSDATFADKWQDEGLYLEKANTDRVNGWMTCKEYMRFGKWFYFADYNESLIDEIVSCPTGDKDPDDILGKGNDPNVKDHALDNWRYGMNSKFVPVKLIPDDTPAFMKDHLLRLAKKKKAGYRGTTVMSG